MTISALRRLVRRPAPAAPTPRPPTGVTLTATGLTRSFGTGDNRTVALLDADLELRAGEMNLLMGPSGSGKSTLLAVISALLRPDAGRVVAAGQDVWTLSEADLEEFRLRHCSCTVSGGCSA